jgi:hypothetical protein
MVECSVLLLRRHELAFNLLEGGRELFIRIFIAFGAKCLPLATVPRSSEKKHLKIPCAESQRIIFKSPKAPLSLKCRVSLL